MKIFESGVLSMSSTASKASIIVHNAKQSPDNLPQPLCFRTLFLYPLERFSANIWFKLLTSMLHVFTYTEFEIQRCTLNHIGCYGHTSPRTVPLLFFSPLILAINLSIMLRWQYQARDKRDIGDMRL